MADEFELFSNKPQGSIWRYTSLAKLLNILEDGELKLVACQAKALDDDYEGTFSKQAMAELETMITGDKTTASAYQSDFGAARNLYTESVRESDRNELGYQSAEQSSESMSAEDKLHNMIDSMREVTYANCWNIGEYEDSNMWFSYTNESDGVVIKSSYDNLEDAIISADKKLFVGEVDYIDFEHKDMEKQPIAPYFHKAKEFRSESEFRFVMTDYEREDFDYEYWSKYMSKQADENANIHLDAAEFIDEIRVHPTSGGYFKEVVKKAISDRSIDLTVSESDLTTNFPE
jgi:hypothetical protein